MSEFESILFNKEFGHNEAIMLISILKIQEKGLCPTCKRVSVLMNVSKATVMRTAPKLEAKGVLKIINEVNAIQGNLPTRFEIEAEKLKEIIKDNVILITK